MHACLVTIMWLIHVFVPDSEDGRLKIGENSKKFLMGRGDIGKIAP